jgi:hypothetical protein
VHFLFSLLSAAALLAASAAWGAQSPGRCAALKTKAAGLRLAAVLACDAAGARHGRARSTACADRARRKFERLFGKAERQGSCGVPGDAVTIGTSVDVFAGNVASGFLPPGAPDTARRCAAKKMLRAGAYGRGRLACWARAFRDGVPVQSQCFDGTASKLVVGFRAAEKKPGCATAGDVSAIEEMVNQFLDGIAFLVMPSGTTTTIVVETSTTSVRPGGATTTSIAGGTTTSIAGGPTTSTTATTAPSPVSFSAAVQPIFTAHCALPGCHSGPTPEEGLDLGAGRSYARLVNVTSRECGQFKRVLPGQPGASYLVFKIDGPPQPCFDGVRMPKNALPLSAADRDTIRTWIMQGAPDN